MSGNDISIEIIKQIGALNERNDDGYRLELNIVNWNNSTPKYDIRYWNLSHDRMTRGIVLTSDEFKRLIEGLSWKASFELGDLDNSLCFESREKEKGFGFKIFKLDKTIILNEFPNGWRKELNIVSWKNEEPKYDIRDWSEDHERMSTGKTFTVSMLEKLYNIGKEHLIELAKETENKTYRYYEIGSLYIANDILYSDMDFIQDKLSNLGISKDELYNLGLQNISNEDIFKNNTDSNNNKDNSAQLERIKNIVSSYIIDDINNAEADYVAEMLENIGITREEFYELGLEDYRNHLGMFCDETIVSFNNGTGTYDETSFDTEDLTEVIDLWEEFAAEEKISINNLQSLHFLSNDNFIDRKANQPYGNFIIEVNKDVENMISKTENTKKEKVR